MLIPLIIAMAEMEEGEEALCKKFLDIALPQADRPAAEDKSSTESLMMALTRARVEMLQELVEE